MNTYRRKIAYQDEAAVEEYLHKFKDPLGKKEHEETTLALKSALEALPGVKRVLDMPCGTGRYTSFLHEMGYRYFGADVSMRMMDALAKEQRDLGRTPPLILCDAEHLPFRDDVFDCVVCVRFLNHHIPSEVRKRMLREMWRVSSRWLIVQSHRLRSMGPVTSLKVFTRKLFGGEISKYLIEAEILQEGWEEARRIPIAEKRFYVGVYEKVQKV